MALKTLKRPGIDPAKVEAMQCLLVPEIPEGDEWLYEVKLDGYRALGSKHGARAALFSRKHKALDRSFPQVAVSLGRLRCRSAVVDGEIVALDESGLPSFQQLQKTASRSASVRFFLFDLLELDGRDLRQRPLEERRERLRRIVPAEDEILYLSPELPGEPQALMTQAAAVGLEGIVAKRRDSLYEPGERSGAWQKWKAEQTGTFLIGGYVPSGKTFDELIIGQKDRKGLRFVARLRAGFVPSTRAKVMASIGPKLKHCPFFNLPEPREARWGQGLTAEEMERCCWVQPTAKVDVAFVEWTEGKKLRHSRFLRVLGKS